MNGNSEQKVIPYLKQPALFQSKKLENSNIYWNSYGFKNRLLDLARNHENFVEFVQAPRFDMAIAFCHENSLQANNAMKFKSFDRFPSALFARRWQCRIEIEFCIRLNTLKAFRCSRIFTVMKLFIWVRILSYAGVHLIWKYCWSTKLDLQWLRHQKIINSSDFPNFTWDESLMGNLLRRASVAINETSWW